MIEQAFDALPAPLNRVDYRKDFAELSATHPTDGSQPKHCLPPGSARADLLAVSFDAVKAEWYDGKIPFLCKSVDALYVHGAEWFLIEFKTGKAELWATLRKAYDSAIALVEHGVMTWAECKEKLAFILVRIDASTRFPYYDLGAITGKNYGPTWEYDPADISDVNDNLDPRVLTDQLFRRFYVMDVPDFISYTASWSN